MWVDLLESHLRAESARFRVTRRAEVYLRAAGLPLERVLDSLRTDEAGWAARVTELRAQERANRAAADRLQAEPCSCQQSES